MEVWKNSRKFGEKAVEVKIPSTGNDWQLYTSSMGCSTAARKLTGAMKRALRSFDTNVGNMGPSKAAHKAFDIWYETALELREYGSADTEPRNEAMATLEKYAVERGFIYKYEPLF